MKKLIALATVSLSLIAFTAPALALPNENADKRAFLAQHINECRVHMQEMVATGQMTKEEMKECIEQMKNGSCLHHSESDTNCCENGHSH